MLTLMGTLVKYATEGFSTNPRFVNTNIYIKMVGLHVTYVTPRLEIEPHLKCT